MSDSSLVSFWLRSRYRLLTLVTGLATLAAIVFSSAQADHAGDAAAQAANDAVMLQVSEEMVAAAQAILDTVADGPGGIEAAVGYNRRELLALSYDDTARTNYVYWPYLRKGLTLEFMSAEQKTLTHDLVNTALSSRGYLSAIQIMQLEQILAGTEVIGFPRGTENYALAIFGEPAMENVWGWRFEGHHLSLNFTVAPGEISVTPSFFGASPAQQRNGTLAGFRSQRAIHEGGLALVNALTPAQQETAVQDGNPPFDVLSGTLNKPRDSWDDWKDLPADGILIGDLDSAQQALAANLVDEITGSYRQEIASSYREQTDITDLRFAWYGSTESDGAHYWRLDGPDFFYEYDLVQGNGNHVHAVWRSKAGDFGSDLLMQHRAEQH